MKKLKVLAINSFPIASRCPTGYFTDHLFNRDLFDVLEYYIADCTRYDEAASEAYKLKFGIRTAKVLDLPAKPSYEKENRIVLKRNYLQSVSKEIKDIVKSVIKALMPLSLSLQIYERIISFNPDVVYTHGYDIRLLRLALLCSRITGIRIVTHTLDNWFSTNKLVSTIQAFYFRKCLITADEHLAGSTACQIYLQEFFGAKSSFISNCCDYNDVHHKRFCYVLPKNGIKIGYIGNLTPLRYLTINILAEEITRQDLSEKVSIHIYTPVEHAQLYRELLHTIVHIHEPVKQTEVRSIYQSFDFLLHVESFDTSVRSFIKYSLTTKLAEILAVKRPLVYLGPQDVGVALFLTQFDVGICSDNVSDLLSQILEIAYNEFKYLDIANKGYCIGKKYFDCEIVQPRFLRVLKGDGNEQ